MDLIIGAGISGLSYAAAKGGDYLIVEAEDQPGGYCKTIRRDGFIWDYSGHFFHFQHPEIRDFVMQRIDPSEMLTVVKHTQILYKDRHVDFPFQMNIHQLPQEEFIDCLYDLFTIPQGAPSTTFKEMLYAKFGRSIAEKFLIPYNTKLYATDLDRLDVDAMGRFFPYADREQIVRNFRHPEGASYNATFLYPRQGCMRIVDSMASHVDMSRVSLGERLLSIDLDAHTAVTNRRTLHYDRLISSMPLPTLLSLSGMGYDPEVYTWNKVLVFNLGFDAKGPEKRNSWMYIPEGKYCFYRVGFYDNIIGQDRMSLYVEIGFSRDQEIGDLDQLLDRTLADLHTAGIVDGQRLVAKHHVVMNPAYVHITRRSEADKQEKMERLSEKDVYSIGRYGAWKYCSLEDNIFDAFALARRLG
ncbi:MAG: FAD-dependent oxidoreductase [Bacteroidales bacterium]|nr:FAD-dependent oxidoreductase [Bacteroidales bacterium]MBP5644810.1 FAD-dependent oxidoreductase [Bacteroidales bacterium]